MNRWVKRSRKARERERKRIEIEKDRERRNERKRDRYRDAEYICARVGERACVPLGFDDLNARMSSESCDGR
jgi:hypothetical protein